MISVWRAVWPVDNWWSRESDWCLSMSSKADGSVVGTLRAAGVGNGEVVVDESLALTPESS